METSYCRSDTCSSPAITWQTSSPNQARRYTTASFGCFSGSAASFGCDANRSDKLHLRHFAELLLELARISPIPELVVDCNLHHLALVGVCGQDDLARVYSERIQHQDVLILQSVVYVCLDEHAVPLAAVQNQGVPPCVAAPEAVPA